MLALFAAGVAATKPVSAQPTFDSWRDGVAREARAHGIRTATVERALRDLAPIERVIELDRRQPEGQMSFADYRRGVVDPTRVETGRRLLATHRRLLGRVEARYGVPARVIVTLWGVESNYGARPGGFPTVASLATLAYDGRRAAFFRKELLSALRILDAGDITLDEMNGSWAGAMGQSQFMPSTFLEHAVDLDGDGRRDIWSSLPDVFASTANYLAVAGWAQGQRWGRPVLAADRVEPRLVGLAFRQSITRWGAMGIRAVDGGALPRSTIDASLIQPDGPTGGSWLAYGNLRAIMVWNRSTYFALSVGLLSDALEDG